MVVVEGEDVNPALDPGLGRDLDPVARDQDHVPSLDLDPAQQESRRRKTQSLVLDPSLGLRSVLSPAQDPREEASLVPALERSLALGRDPDPNLVTRRGTLNPGLVQNPRRDPSLAPGQARNPSLARAPTTQSPAQGLALSLEERSAPHPDPAAKKEKLKELAAILNPSLDLNRQQKTETNLHMWKSPALVRSLRRKWKKTAAEILLRLRTATIRTELSLLQFINKINVMFFSELLVPLVHFLQ